MAEQTQIQESELSPLRINAASIAFGAISQDYGAFHATRTAMHIVQKQGNNPFYSELIEQSHKYLRNVLIGIRDFREKHKPDIVKLIDVSLTGIDQDCRSYVSQDTINKWLK